MLNAGADFMLLDFFNDCISDIVNEEKCLFVKYIEVENEYNKKCSLPGKKYEQQYIINGIF